MKSIKAIETSYKGYRFRSRLEARWAVFFDAMGIEWEYEPEGFHLSSGERYLPDFYLPKYDSWIEIKGKKAKKGETDKCLRLLNDLGGSLEAIDLIALGDTRVTWGIFGKISEMCPKDSSLEYKQNVLSDITKETREKTKVYLFEGLVDSGWFFTNEQTIQIHAANALWFLFGGNKDDIYSSFLKARSARFEHGENP